MLLYLRPLAAVVFDSHCTETLLPSLKTVPNFMLTPLGIIVLRPLANPLSPSFPLTGAKPGIRVITRHSKLSATIGSILAGSGFSSIDRNSTALSFCCAGVMAKPPDVSIANQTKPIAQTREAQG